MRIRITSVTSISDGAGNRYRSGDVVTVDDALGRSWVAAGHATAADGGAKRAATRRAPRKGTAQAETEPEPEPTDSSE